MGKNLTLKIGCPPEDIFITGSRPCGAGIDERMLLHQHRVASEGIQRTRESDATPGRSVSHILLSIKYLFRFQYIIRLSSLYRTKIPSEPY